MASLFPEDEGWDLGDWGNASPPTSEPVTEPAAPDEWAELEALFAERAPVAPASAPQNVASPPEEETPLFAWPEVAPEPDKSSVAPPQEMVSPPPGSSQSLWAEIGHLFQTPAFRQPETVEDAGSPGETLRGEAMVDALSQAMLANDGSTIQTLVQQIQQTYDHAQSIEILLAALHNWCR